MILNTRRCDGKLWDLVKKYPIHPRVLEVIELSGLYSVYRSNRSIIDRSLITSLVERWRPDTHMFHFRTGEATITLQDVEVLYGLPMNGDPILGDESMRTIGDWQNICQRLLGFILRPQDFNRSSLKVTALNAHMLEQLQLPDLATQDIINQMARCYMFWMIADTTKHVLKVFRDALDSMTEDQFIWESYSDDLVESLPDYCRIGRDIWGRPNTNWKIEHAQWLPFWNQQLQYICDAPVNREPLQYDDPYLIWFRRITRLVIGNPTQRPQQEEGYVPNSTAYETMVCHIHSMADREKALGD
ncbi:hypothetical protein RDI58_028585 [Solanum bulbocastanum]|uniref:Aminotransferase-like plant mobile domain-containing protein n=1 Tax=Solanum bulbocastanum TaxID=147425 RepID=A0AAN8ST36_SOLBU